MSVRIAPATEDDARVIAAVLEDGICPYPGYDVQALTSQPWIYILDDDVARAVLTRLYPEVRQRVRLEGDGAQQVLDLAVAPDRTQGETQAAVVETESAQEPAPTPPPAPPIESAPVEAAPAVEAVLAPEPVAATEPAPPPSSPPSSPPPPPPPVKRTGARARK